MLNVELRTDGKEVYRPRIITHVHIHYIAH